MKLVKRSLALVLALVLMALCSVSAFAATKNNVKQYNIYLQLGDSVAVGFSQPGFDRTKHKVRVAGTYGDLLAKDVKAKKFYPYAQMGFRSSEIRMLLDNSYNGDELTDTEVARATDGYATKANLKAQRKQYQAAVKKADLITIDVGLNDLWLPFVGATDQQLYEMPKAFVDYLTHLYDDFEENYKVILKKIYKLNPDVKVVSVGTYNPSKHWGVFPVYWGKVLDPMFQHMNDYKKSFTKVYGAKYKYADVSDTETHTEYMVVWFGVFDPHPTQKGYYYMEEQILKVLPAKKK